MAEEMKFNNRFNNIGGSSSYLSTIIQAKNEAAKPNDVANITNSINSITGTATSVVNTKNAIDANAALQASKEFIYSEEYQNATPNEKLNLMEQFSNQYAEQSPIARDTVFNALGSEYAKQHGAVQKDKERVSYNNFYALSKVAVDSADSNKEEVLSALIDGYATSSKDEQGVNLDKGILKNMYLDGRFGDIIEQIQAGHIEEAKQDFTKFKEDFSSKVYLGTTAKPAQNAVKQKIAQIEKMFKANASHQTDFELINAKNVIATSESNGYDKTAAELDPYFQRVALDSKTGVLDLGKYADLKSKYVKEQTEMHQYIDFTNNNDFTTPLSFEYTNNKLIKKEMPKLVSTNIQQELSQGHYQKVNSIIQANAGYLGETKRIMMNSLFNESISEKDRELAWSTMDTMAEDPTGITAMRSILGGDIKKVLAINIARKYLGYSLNEATSRINKYYDNPDSKYLDSDTKEAIADANENYGPLQDEFETLVRTSIALGIDKETAVKAAVELMDTHVKEVGGIPAFELTGTVPTPTEEGAPVFNNAMEQISTAYEELNNGNPIQMEVLNNGKAIFRDATWGYRLPGMVDMNNIKEYVDREAVERGPNPTKTEITRVWEQDIVQPVATGARTAKAAVVSSPMFTAWSKVASFFSDEIDSFNPPTPKEKLATAREDYRKKMEAKNQSQASKSLILTPTVHPQSNIMSGTSNTIIQHTTKTQSPINEGFLNTVASVESNSSYTANRPGSKFYGKYQMGPEALEDTFKVTGLNEDTWKTPLGQEKTVRAHFNILAERLNKTSIPVNSLTLWGAHNQGVTGLLEIYNSTKTGKPVSMKRAEKIRQNLPSSLRGKVTLDNAAMMWLNYYKDKFKID